MEDIFLLYYVLQSSIRLWLVYSEKTKKTFVNTESLYIPQELLTNNLPKRLTNAFNNLIELCC